MQPEPIHPITPPALVYHPCPARCRVARDPNATTPYRVFLRRPAQAHTTSLISIPFIAPPRPTDNRSMSLFLRQDLRIPIAEFMRVAATYSRCLALALACSEIAFLKVSEDSVPCLYAEHRFGLSMGCSPGIY